MLVSLYRLTGHLILSQCPSGTWSVIIQITVPHKWQVGNIQGPPASRTAGISKTNRLVEGAVLCILTARFLCLLRVV